MCRVARYFLVYILYTHTKHIHSLKKKHINKQYISAFHPITKRNNNNKNKTNKMRANTVHSVQQYSKSSIHKTELYHQNYIHKHVREMIINSKELT